MSLDNPISIALVTDLLDEWLRFFPPLHPPLELDELDELIESWADALSPLTATEASQASALWTMTGDRFPYPADVLRCASLLRAARVVLSIDTPVTH
jgi:hypothetical protein